MRNTHKFYTFFFTLLLCAGTSAWADGLPVQNIDQAYDRVLRNNPTLKAQGLRIEGLKALINQANLIPNPELSVESENFSGSRSGWDEAENTFALSQKIELGGKRSARTSLAKSQATLFEAAAQLRIANLIRDVQIAYSNVVLSQKLFNLADEQEQFAKTVVRTATDKVAHGGILAGEKTKAEIALRVISIDKQKSENRLDQSKRALASFWNGTANDVADLTDLLGDDLTTKLSLPPVDETLALKARSSQVTVSQQAVRNERAQVIPDITFTGGYRRFEETDDDAFVAGISVPLPFFNRNRGRITQAIKEVEANKAEYVRSETSVKAQLDNLMQTRKVLQMERATILKHLLPDSEQALTDIRKAYRFGRVGYLDLIDSQEVYFGAKEREAQNLFELRSNEATIKAITGQILQTIEEAKSHE